MNAPATADRTIETLTSGGTLLQAATSMVQAGYSVIPCNEEKKASIHWKQYQKRPMTEEEIVQYFTRAKRLATVCGSISGNLEVLDFDDPATYTPFLELVESRQKGLTARLPKRQTPSGGYHLIYRCEKPIQGNQKLACDKDNKARIETRGEGGYALAPPSRGYIVLEHSLLKCPILTAEEVSILHSAAKAFDLRDQVKSPPPAHNSTGTDRPGDQFNKENPLHGLLLKYGWKEDRRTSAGMGYTRPGKDQGTSAVLLEETGNLYCWSSNAYPLEPGESYSAFTFFAAYEHGGDYSAAARSIALKKTEIPTIDISQNITVEKTVEEWEPVINKWPTMDEKAYHGIAGAFVQLAAEKSEADPAAILVTFLIRCGVEVGSGPTLFIGDTRHKARFAGVIVGASSKARKGTSGKPIERLFGPIENKARYSPGPFSSGEGIIFAVRDKVMKWDEKNQVEVVTDPGIEDKRLFILDEEFAGAMAQTKREGNTLSMVIRNMWDNGNLDPLTKTCKTTATNAHVGWISHITTTELHARLSESEAFNGFANRILWICARRSKIVPLPEPMDDERLDAIRQQLVERIAYFRNQDFVKIAMGAEAKKAWVDHYYAALTKDNPGLVGCVINRAEAQVARLSMLYCLLDGKATIALDHLEAAVALWRYCEASARFIFHGRQTDGIAEKILENLAVKPLTSTELFALFHNNVSKARLQTALSGLVASNQIESDKAETDGKGRPPLVWKLKTPNESNERNERSTTPEPFLSSNSLLSLSTSENAEIF